MAVDPIKIIDFFYGENDPAREILLLHSTQVRNKALAVARNSRRADLDLELIASGAMLHDIGIRFCFAPGLGCFGQDEYILHGITGAEKLRFYGFSEELARICERHTGSGLTADEIVAGKLPLPERDYLPETPEEKIICLADKFFSKSGDFEEKSLDKICGELAKFGTAPLARFKILCSEFNIKGI